MKSLVRGLFYGDGGQFVAELIGGIVNFVWFAAAGWVLFKLLDKIAGNRVKPEVELSGLDLHEMGLDGYAGFKMDKNTETPLSR